jgi:cysteine desulfurase
MSSVYLNTSSTSASETGKFNPSDFAYPEVFSDRERLEYLKVRLKKMLNAPIDASVVFNSGSTESIANCIFWAKNNNPYGVITGSDFDHPSVPENCKNMDVEYSTKMTNKTGAIFITHVNSKTGEIFEIENFINNFYHNYSIFEKDGFNPYHDKILQYRPLIFLDAAQSITKLPIDMDKWHLDAVFFSLHKIGGPLGLGVLVVKFGFKPLIAGYQQNHLRGGTLDILSVLEYEDIFDKKYVVKKDKWIKIKQELDKSGLKVYNPKYNHLYNTFLISTGGKCPLGLINKLAMKGIFVGNISACENELIDDKDTNKTLKGGNNNFDTAIRLSVNNLDDIDSGVVEKIVESVKNI